MSEKRFTIHKENMYKEDWYDYPFCIKEDGEVVLETIPLYIAEKVRDKLNEQEATIQSLKEENEQLKKELKGLNRKYIAFSEATDKRLKEMMTIPYSKKVGELEKEIHRWKNLYDLKDAEVTARVDALNKVCEYYTSEVLFKSDVDPNKAVKEVINEILNTEVEMMSDCDNCIYLDQDHNNGEYCHKGHTGHKTLIHDCCDFEHWNTLTPEERRPQCND